MIAKKEFSPKKLSFNKREKWTDKMAQEGKVHATKSDDLNSAADLPCCNQRAKSCKLSSHLHTHAVTNVCPPPKVYR